MAHEAKKQFSFPRIFSIASGSRFQFRPPLTQIKSSEVTAAMCRLVYLKGRCNIPSFPKSCHWGGHNHVTWREARSWAWRVKRVEFVFKIRALHWTHWSLELGSWRGAFNLKIAACWNNNNRTTRQLQRPRRRTDCCDQLFPGFKTLSLWVAQQCTSSKPLPISCSCRLGFI